MEWRDITGETPLYTSARYNELDDVKELLSMGADPNVKDYVGDPILFSVITENVDLNILTALLLGGADPNICNVYKFTALHEAVDLCKVNVVHILLRFGADLELKDDGGRTPMYLINVKRNIPEIREISNEMCVMMRDYFPTLKDICLRTVARNKVNIFMIPKDLYL